MALCFLADGSFIIDKASTKFIFQCLFRDRRHIYGNHTGKGQIGQFTHDFTFIQHVGQNLCEQNRYITVPDTQIFFALLQRGRGNEIFPASLRMLRIPGKSKFFFPSRPITAIKNPKALLRIERSQGTTHSLEYGIQLGIHRSKVQPCFLVTVFSAGNNKVFLLRDFRISLAYSLSHPFICFFRPLLIVWEGDLLLKLLR